MKLPDGMHCTVLKVSEKFSSKRPKMQWKKRSYREAKEGVVQHLIHLNARLVLLPERDVCVNFACICGVWRSVAQHIPVVRSKKYSTVNVYEHKHEVCAICVSEVIAEAAHLSHLACNLRISRIERRVLTNWPVRLRSSSSSTRLFAFSCTS